MSLKAINWEFISDKQKINWDLSFICIFVGNKKQRKKPQPP